MQNLHVYVGMTIERQNMDICGVFLGPGTNGQIVNVSCHKLPTGSKVLLILDAASTKQLLNFTEVEVYGLPH